MLGFPERNEQTDANGGVEQWRPLVEYVFAMWELDTTKCGTGDRANDCVGPQVDNAMVKKPRLTDVFLQLTGRELRE